MGLAASLRFYRLADVPPGLYLDEAGNGLDALDVLAGRPTIFFARSLGKEPLLNYLIVPFVALLGREPLAVRLPAALVGVATVPAVFFLAYELLQDMGRRKAAWAALLAAGLVAGSYWAISINRISFRANTLPLVMTLAFACTWRVLRLGGTGRAIGAGALLGLCFYTYLAGRFVYLLILLAAALIALTREGRTLLRRRRREILILACTCLLVMAPLLGYFAAHPADFVRRARLVTGMDSEAPTDLRMALWVQHVASNLGMFGGPGDDEPRHNIPGRSLLSPWLAVLFWSGLLICAGRATRLAVSVIASAVAARERSLKPSAGARSVRAMRDTACAVALVWFFVMLLPSILAVTTPRHMLRTIGALPITYFFPAVTVITLWQALSDRLTQRSRNVLTVAWGGLAALLIIGEAGITAHDYFGRWADSPTAFEAFQGSDRAIANEINRATNETAFIVPLSARWKAASDKYTLDFLVRQAQAVHYFFSSQSDAAVRLADFLARRRPRTVRIVRFTSGDDVLADPGELASLLLNQVGQRVAVEDGRGYYTEVYSLSVVEGRPVLPVADRPAATVFRDGVGPALRLIGWGVAPSQAAGGVHLTSAGRGAVALRWSVERSDIGPLRISLVLRDTAGYVFGQADSFLLDSRSRYSQDWGAGDVVTTWHTLIAAAGAPPGIYRLALIVYRADTGMRLTVAGPEGQPQDTIMLGEIQVGPPLPLAEMYRAAEPLPVPIELGAGLTLIAVNAPMATVAAGLWLDVGLGWEAAARQDAQIVRFALDDREVWRAALPTLPAGVWHTQHRVPLPTDLPEGEHVLCIGLAGDGGVAHWHEIARVRVEAPPTAQTYRAAVFRGGVRLVGWRLSETEGSIEVTLLWQADRPQTQDYTVFVHLLDETGKIVAQHDAAPGDGRYVLSRWPVGPLVPDHHKLAASVHPGMRLRVGLYLPGSGARLPLVAGDDAVEWRVEP